MADTVYVTSCALWDVLGHRAMLRSLVLLLSVVGTALAREVYIKPVDVRSWGAVLVWRVGESCMKYCGYGCWSGSWCGAEDGRDTCDLMYGWVALSCSSMKTVLVARSLSCF